MTLLNRVENLEHLINQDDYLKQIPQSDSLKTSETIKKELQEFDNNDGVLRIGIVGRVKAGKSSLLNALIFDGEDVLPKAATPMTAALTIMKYSEQMRAEVDFFSDEDLKKLAEEHKEYKEHLKRLEAEEIAIEKAKRPEKQDMAKAKRRAERKLKDSPYAAGADQYERILASGITSVSNLEKYRHISATSMAELNQKLSEFVGANGKYMPFTKSVTLYLPEPKLEGLEIVDTPGINDPVQSRGKRTEAMLALCHVVLMVSPTGQFLSEQDAELISKMIKFNGVGSAYLIASQCDSQLFGSEYAKQNIHSILDKIRNTLSHYKVDTLSKMKGNESEEKLISIIEALSKNELILTSGACYGLAKYFDQSHKWDETQQHIHKLLSENFPQDFSSKEKSLAILNKLSNIDKITDILKKVDVKRDELLASKIDNYISGQVTALDDRKKILTDKLNKRVENLKTEDVTSKKLELEELSKKGTSINSIILEEYKKYKKNIGENLAESLKNVLKQQMRRFVRGEKETGYTEREESYEVKVSSGSTLRKFGSWLTGGWIDNGDRWETRYRTIRESYSYVRATPVRESIIDILDILNSKLASQTDYVLKDVKGKLHIDLGDKLYTLDRNNFKLSNIKDTLDKVLDKLPKATFKVDSLPSHLDKYGQLTGSEGDRFLKDAQEYISQLERNVQNQIVNYVEKLVVELEKINLSDSFMETHQKELTQLKEELSNKDESIKKYQDIISKLAKI